MSTIKPKKWQKNARELRQNLEDKIGEWLPFNKGGLSNLSKDMMSRLLGQPAVDVYEIGVIVHVRVELPGVDTEDLKVELQDDKLKIKADKSPGVGVSDREYSRAECLYGKVERVVKLPDDVNADQAEAVYERGVLHISLPKAQSARPKRFKVNVIEGGAQPRQPAECSSENAPADTG